MMRMLVSAAVAWAAAIVISSATFITAALAQAPDPIMRIWMGAYGAAQAERGKAVFAASCTDCHAFDLSGGSGPPLVGQRFMTKWESENLNTLFRKIRDTMPRNDPGRLTDEAALEIVAFILRSNGFPPGDADLRANGETLAGFAIVPKSGPTRKELPNFSLVQVVGCLTQSANQAWLLSRATDPVSTKDAPAAPADLRQSEAATGAQTFRLVSVLPFQPAPHQGHRMYVKGVLNRTPDAMLLNVTSLQMIGASCP